MIEGVKPQALSKVLDDEMAEFIQQCLEHAHKRPKASELLNSKFLQDLDSEKNNESVPILEEEIKRCPSKMVQNGQHTTKRKATKAKPAEVTDTSQVTKPSDTAPTHVEPPRGQNKENTEEHSGLRREESTSEPNPLL